MIFITSDRFCAGSLNGKLAGKFKKRVTLLIATNFVHCELFYLSSLKFVEIQSHYASSGCKISNVCDRSFCWQVLVSAKVREIEKDYFFQRREVWYLRSQASESWCDYHSYTVSTSTDYIRDWIRLHCWLNNSRVRSFCKLSMVRSKIYIRWVVKISSFQWFYLTRKRRIVILQYKDSSSSQLMV